MSWRQPVARSVDQSPLSLWRTHSCVPCRDSYRHVFARAHEEASARLPTRHAGVRAPLLVLSYFSTSATSSGLSCSRKALVLALSNFGSDASMHRKNRSMDAREKPGTLNTG